MTSPGTLIIQPPAPKIGACLDTYSSAEIVESYTSVDPVSTHYKRQCLTLIQEHPDHFANRYNYDHGIHGHFVAQAFVHHPGRNAIALMHHKKLNIWIGQGGHVEPGDADLLATAWREAVEEGGFKGLRLVQPEPIDLDIHGFPAKGDQPDHLHYDIRFLFQTDDDTLHLNEAEGLQIEWVKVADLRARMGFWLSNSRLIQHLEARFGV